MWVYSGILVAALSGILYGLSSLDAVDLTILHERAPLFVTLSDGSIQNRYTLKLLDKMPEELKVRVSVTGPQGLVLVGADEPITIHAGGVTPAEVFLKVPRANLTREQEPIRFRVEAVRPNGQVIKSERISVFVGPPR